MSTTVPFRTFRALIFIALSWLLADRGAAALRAHDDPSRLAAQAGPWPGKKEKDSASVAEVASPRRFP
jgi:hypothetical protein